MSQELTSTHDRAGLAQSRRLAANAGQRTRSASQRTGKFQGDTELTIGCASKPY